MKNPPETARRWLAQAEHSLGSTQVLVDNGLWSDACFQAEQTAQFVLKAFLYGQGRRFINIHSVRQLAKECSQHDGHFSSFDGHGMMLDRYYLTTRYPHTLPAPAIPYQSFAEPEARQALEYATEIVDLVRARVPSQ